MIIRRKKLPNGDDRPNPENAAIDMIDKEHRRDMAWAAGHIYAIERRLYDMSERCDKCPYRDYEGSACRDEDEISE